MSISGFRKRLAGRHGQIFTGLNDDPLSTFNEAMLQMKKLDINELKRAYAG